MDRLAYGSTALSKAGQGRCMGLHLAWLAVAHNTTREEHAEKKRTIASINGLLERSVQRSLAEEDPYLRPLFDAERGLRLGEGPEPDEL
jgi:hypothetical protein